MRLGSEAHEILETGRVPPVDVLNARGLGDLRRVFESAEWCGLAELPIERELPFIMSVGAGGQESFVRGRMDAVLPGDPPRVIDYKFALWRDGGEDSYQIQMTAYSLALMKALSVDRAVSEIWFLKTPMKIVRQEHTRAAAEQKLASLLESYLHALHSNEWPMAARPYCDSIECGFRDRCWGPDSVAESEI